MANGDPVEMVRGTLLAEIEKLGKLAAGKNPDMLLKAGQAFELVTRGTKED
jgi:hypothetical protein